MRRCRCSRSPASTRPASISTSSRPPPGNPLHASEREEFMSVRELSAEARSAAAGAKVFPGSDSRRYNYFEPKGRKATHYEDVTVDVQPDPERYLLQDWIIAFGDGTPTYSKSWTALMSSDWHEFRAPDQEWERTHYQRQSTIVGMIQNVVEN